jgi:hypothetical protein|tara:strand:- start:4 stop:204 length:201 start_codon:yes stop_codon:yes gene_type:complete
MKNRQVSISIKYGPDVYKKNFMEQDALAYIDFLETSGLWYEIEEAKDGEQPKLDEDNIEKDDTNEQ